MARKKETKRTIRKNRVAAIVAGILALGMILSTATFVGGPMLLEIFAKDRSNPPGSQWDLETYREYINYEIENLEKHVAEYGPTVAVLEELAQHYSNLFYLEKMLNEESETLEDYEQKMLKAFQDLIELEPEEPRYRLWLLNAYLVVDAEAPMISAEVEALAGLLHETPNLDYHFSFIDLLQELEYAAKAREEIDWLKDYLAERLSGADADNTERYSYAYLLAEYDEDKEAALEQLAIILDEEESDSILYKQAELYRDKLMAEDKVEENDNDNSADGGADE